MREALTSFETEVDKLVRFLDASDAEEDLVAAILRGPEVVRADLDVSLSVIRNNSTINRRQRYVSSIIVMYGALERFVEEAVAEYSGILVHIHQEFQKLPERLREQHTRLTIEYLALLKDRKIRETEDISTIVETLHNCLNDRMPFRLNARAFTVRSSNMTLARIGQIMHNLDISIQCRRVVSTPTYAAFLAESYGVSVTDMKDREIKGTIEHVDELVRLRNDVAHGVANIGSIDTGEIVRERICKLRAFVSGLNEILACEILSFRIALGHLVPIQGDVEVFGNHVACFSFPEGRLVPGDYLVMRPGDQSGDLRYGPIASIQVDQVDKTVVEGHEGLMVGVCVQFKVKANGTFYVWHSVPRDEQYGTPESKAVP